MEGPNPRLLNASAIGTDLHNERQLEGIAKAKGGVYKGANRA